MITGLVHLLTSPFVAGMVVLITAAVIVTAIIERGQR